ncbi:hypothetical protein C9374_011958 [Naegleria lovaniensis]|uniref:Uncharacterized protein n=1 Tax=Naegleria lovaniensis TaxID=51637 RepID=A0AA88KEG2_NAELO|nr:uncharacterized protein C9374_011958 [Naegleria lovaniensis]KAG2373669.1 hypothetical protein C9374_011958 [Naegleria lovaniensis]
MSQPPSIVNSTSFQETGIIPPPPPLSSLTNINWNARNKKFKLDTSIREFDERKISKHPLIKKRLQIQPYLHYNLNRNFTIITYMDESNEFTKCPTLISFGGPHVRDKTIYYLELDPPKTRVDSENDNYQVEHEWKELETVANPYGEYFKNNMLQIQNGSMIYSKKLQKLIVFQSGSQYFKFYFLCLKNRTWIKKRFCYPNLSYCWDVLLTKYDEDGSKGLVVTRSFMSVLIVDLEELFSTNNENYLITLPAIAEAKTVATVASRMIVPLPTQHQILVVGSSSSCTKFKEEARVISVDLTTNTNSTTDISEGMQMYNQHHSACAYPFEQKTSSTSGAQVLITLLGNHGHLFFEYDTQTKKSTFLSHNPLPIQLEHHAFFPPFLCTYRNRRNERCAVYIPNLDILYKIKLDYDKPENAFPYLKKQLLEHEMFKDIAILHK